MKNFKDLPSSLLNKFKPRKEKMDNFVVTSALNDHLSKVRTLVNNATEDYNFNVKCVNSNVGYYNLIALDTSSYDGKTLTKAAIDVVEVPSSGERENIMASINAYCWLVQSKANAAGKIGKKDMQDILNSFYCDQRMAAA